MTAASAEPELPGVQVCGNCHQVRRTAALVPDDDGGWRCAEPCRKPGGRPPVGPPVLIRMPPELRAAVEAQARPGEKLAAAARRLLADAVAAAEDQAPAPAGPNACPRCGGPRKLSLGNVASCGQCGGIYELPPAPVPAGYQIDPARSAAASSAPDGPRVVLAEDLDGAPVVVGPVYTAKGVTKLETLIRAQPGWSVIGAARSVSKSQLEWSGVTK